MAMHAEVFNGKSWFCHAVSIDSLELWQSLDN